MAYRTIQADTWDDPWFTDLAPNSKLLFLYLITNRRVSQCGAMEITVRQIAFETGFQQSQVGQLIDSLGDRIRWWQGSSLLIVRNFYRYQRANTGEKYDIAARKSAEVLPDFAREWVYGLYPHLAPDDYTHPIPTPEPMDTHGVSNEEQIKNTTNEEHEQSDSPTPVAFADWYAIYPKHEGKSDAEKAWKKLKPPEQADAFEALKFQILWPKMRGDPRFIPLPATWLNARRWEDEPPQIPINGYQNGRASPNGSHCPYPVPSRKGEDWERLRSGMEPAWGSAQGGIDTL